MRNAHLDWRIWAAAAAGVAAIAGVVLSQWFGRPDHPDEIERQRRAHINQVGRIVEGQIVELMEMPVPPAEPRRFALFQPRKPSHAAANGHHHLIRYSYSISGVRYETAQDVTGLEERTRLDQLAAGQRSSVKYDPSNPSNSILVADNWSGLR